jgi:hypothetical protein
VGVCGESEDMNKGGQERKGKGEKIIEPPELAQ